MPYAEQGDPEMYTKSMLKAREELRRNPGIEEAVKRVSVLIDARFVYENMLSGVYFLRWHCALEPKHTSLARFSCAW